MFDLFKCNEDDREAVSSKWIIDRVTAMCCRECGEEMWKTKLKKVTDMVKEIREWEQKRGNYRKPFSLKVFPHFEKKRRLCTRSG